VRIEFLVTAIVTVILFVWSILLNAPLEEPANPNLTMNPSKSALVLFSGCRKMLVYFDLSLDCRRGDAEHHHDRPDGVPTSIREPARQRILHAETEALCHCHVLAGICPDVDRL